MPNSIKYSASAQSLALRKGNFWIGTGDVGKGPTSTTDYYNGITPPSGGYTICLNKANNGPSIYTCANDSQLISLTNTLAGASYTTAAECLNWFSTQTDKMVFNQNYEGIVTNGLAEIIDAGFSPSYPTTGTTWYDLSPNTNNGSLTNGPAFSSSNGGSIVFDGTNDYVSVTNSNSLYFSNGMTIQMFVKLDTLPPSSSGSRMYLVTKGDNNQFEWQTSINNFSSDYGKWCFLRYAATSPGGALNGGSFRGRASSSDATTGTWTGVAFTLSDPSSFNDVYINGVLNNGSTLSQNTMNVVQGTSDVRVGTRNFGEYYLDGNMGVVLLYNRGLSAAEVLQNHNSLKTRFGI